jgi:hypothetical protein
MECFRVDESGYTGYDLLNADQHFQGATAIAISDEDARRLIKEHFPRLQAEELKYRSLAKRPSNHARLMAIQRELIENYKCVTYICDKRFLLALMFVDYAVEPHYYERGYDLYADGQNYSLASLIYTVGPAVLGKAYNNLMSCFQRAIKDKTPQSLDDLIKASRSKGWERIPEAFGPLAQFASPECLAAIATPGVTTDAALIVLQSLISRMEVMADGTYCVEHDQSKNLLTYHELLKKFINHNESVTFKQSEIASFTFPLKLQSVTQVDSKLSPAVQLADVMIGAAIEAANTIQGIRRGELDAIEVLSLYPENQLIHLLPSTDFEAQKKYRKNTQAAEMIDYFGSKFF